VVSIVSYTKEEIERLGKITMPIDLAPPDIPVYSAAMGCGRYIGKDGGGHYLVEYPDTKIEVMD